VIFIRFAVLIQRDGMTLLLVLLCNFFLASTISSNKVLLSMFPAILFVGIRMLCAEILICVYAYCFSTRMRWRYIKHDIGILVGVSLFTTYLPSILKAFSLKHLFSSKAAFYGSIDPFITALYAYFLWHEKLSWKQFVGIIIGFSGIVIMTLGQTPPEQGWHAWFILFYPELASFASVVVSRWGWILLRALVRNERYTPLEVNGMSMVGSGILALITATMLNQWKDVSIPSVSTFLCLFVYTVIIGNVTGYMLYAYVIKHVNLTFVSLAGFSIPIFVGLIGWLLLAEPMSYSILLAGLFVFLGLLIFYYDELCQVAGARSGR